MSRFEKVDLDGGNWHSGMTEIKSNGSILEYNKSYRDDCIRKDELADVVYLRSGNKQRAFGVITNRRANYYTLGVGDCKDEEKIPPPVHSNQDDFEEFNEVLQAYGMVSADDSMKTALRLRNMDMNVILPREFKIKYYSPYDQNNSIKEETRWSPILKLEHPDLDTLDIILFEVFPMGENFKSASNNALDSSDSFNREPKKEDDVKIYPNPNNGNFVIAIDNSTDVKAIYILDNLGKRVDTRKTVGKENNYNISNLRSGVYFVEVVFNDKLIRKKVIIN